MPDTNPLLETPDDAVYQLISTKPGPVGTLPVTADLLRHAPSGDLFGWSQNVGMGLNPSLLGRAEYLILSTHGGLRGDDGSPVALGFHSGHWEVGLLVKAAAEEFQRLKAIPFAGAVTDPCDGRTQGTAGMFDSLPYRNDAATVMRRLMRSLPTRAGVLGIATCDKGLPAMMMALASRARPADRARARRRHARGRRRRRRHGQGADDRGPLRERHHDHRRGRRGRVPCVRLARRRLPVPRHRGHVAGRRRSAWA